MVVVTGCLTQRYSKDLPKLLPEVDLFIGTGEYQHLPELIRKKRGGAREKTFVDKPEYVPDAAAPRLQTTAPWLRYVKISEGCSHRCSFCIIPTLRGGVVRSRPVHDIAKEISAGIGHGVREFNLVAQDLNEYGRDLSSRSSLYALLDDIDKIPGDYWIRLLYMYPLQFPDRLVKRLAESEHVLRYVDIPLQHIADSQLKKMNRGSSARYIHRLIDNLRKHMPDIVLRTTFIVGHPGETKKDFSELEKFIRETEFDNVGIFTFSREESTASSSMGRQVPEEIKQERRARLMEIQKEISLKKNRARIGQKLRVLHEGVSSETDLLHQGRFYGQAPEIDGTVLIRSGKAVPGSFCEVQIVDGFEYDLLGEIVDTVRKDEVFEV